MPDSLANILKRKFVWISIRVDSLPRWAALHPSNWTSVELTRWLEYVAEEYKMDSETTHNMVESFQDLDGRRLLQMTLEDFRGISEQHGEFLFEIFKKMCTVGKQVLIMLFIINNLIQSENSLLVNKFYTDRTNIKQHKTNVN